VGRTVAARRASPDYIRPAFAPAAAARYRGPMHVRTARASIALLLASAAAAPAAAPPATMRAAVFATPADVLAAARRAKDDPNQFDYFTPDAQDQLARMIVFMVVRGRPTTLPADVQAAKAEFEAAWGLDRREPRPGESDEQRIDRLLEQIPDKRTFLVDFRRRQQATTAPARPAPSTRPASVLEDVQISPDGTTATGRLVHREDERSSTSQQVKFRKIDGSWRIDQPALMR